MAMGDCVFLAIEGIRRDNFMLQKVSPKVLRRLHNLIDEKRVQIDPQSRAAAMMNALSELDGAARSLTSLKSA